MSRVEIYKALTEVFRDVFDDDKIVLEDRTTASDIPDWDSLMHINLIIAIQDEFSIKFSMDDVLAAKNVGDMVDIIENLIKRR